MNLLTNSEGTALTLLEALDNLTYNHEVSKWTRSIVNFYGQPFDVRMLCNPVSKPPEEIIESHLVQLGLEKDLTRIPVQFSKDNTSINEVRLWLCAIY